MSKRKQSDDRYSKEVRIAVDTLRAARRQHASGTTGGIDTACTPPAADNDYLVTTIMLEIFSGCDGWLRAVPSDEGTTYWKWKFTTGRWPNHYVMYRQYPFEPLLQALYGLADKVAAVRDGCEKPVKDKYYQ